MMPDEEIIKLFREMKALLDDYERSLMFAEAVWIELKPIPIEFFPYMEAQCKFNEDKLRTEARYNAQCLYFCVVKCIMEDEQNTEGNISINYETRQNIVERKQRSLDKLILLFPPDKHEFIYQMFAEDDAEDLPHEEFMFKCHNVAKAVILGFFPEIAELNGNSIRKIDNMSYIEMSDWVQSFYEHSEFDTITRSSAEDVHGCVRLVFEPVSCVVNGAVCLISGAQVLLTRCAAAIAGLLAAMHEAKREIGRASCRERV